MNRRSFLASLAGAAAAAKAIALPKPVRLGNIPVLQVPTPDQPLEYYRWSIMQIWERPSSQRLEYWTFKRETVLGLDHPTDFCPGASWTRQTFRDHFFYLPNWTELGLTDQQLEDQAKFLGRSKQDVQAASRWLLLSCSLTSRIIYHFRWERNIWPRGVTLLGP